MKVPGRSVDPVEEYVETLASALHGPARAKARLVAEIRDGLADTVAAHTREGTPHAYATHQAMREFGTADELVPSCQRELTIAQARHTARAVAFTVPFLIACWFLIPVGGHGQGRQLQVSAVWLAGVAAGAALSAAVVPAITGTLARRLPVPQWLPLVVAWTGTAAGAAMALATLVLATGSALATNWPLTAVACALTAASHAVVATSARACRRCARLPSEPAV